MKRTIFIAICTASIISSCNDDLYEPLTLAEAKTRSITQLVSPTFDWEDTTTIVLINVPGNVTLPWYTGALANIPNYILNDYKAEDGWKMVYNTCSPSGLAQDDKYYLIFYNIFNGRLRGYVYNKNNVTSATDTYWQLLFSNTTRLLNDTEKYTLANDTITDNLKIQVSNPTNTNSKALTRGWNVFDVDLLVYDPNLSSSNLSFAISANDISRTDIKLSGDIQLSSNGSMLTITKIPQVSTGGILGGFASALGSLAENKFLEIFSNGDLFQNPDIETLASNGVGGIVEAGGNWLVNKFLGRKTTIQTITSNSDIKISTDGTIST